MKRGGLFFIGLLSAIVIIISLNIALGSSGYYYHRYPYCNRFHYCDGKYYNERSKHDQNSDSANSNY